MIARVLIVWLVFSVVLLLLGLFSQGEPFEISQLALAIALSSPVAVSVLRGGLGHSSERQLQYPSLSLMVVSAWILLVGPSLIVESQAARYLYHYSDASLTLARLFFFGWCLLFTVGAGRPRLNQLHARPNIMEFIACTAFALLIITFLMRAGLFSNYQSSRVRLLGPGAGSTESAASVLGAPLFTLLPPLLFLMLVRIQGRATQTFVVFVGFLASWTLLFLLGSRTGVAVAIASCLLLCRGLGMRLRANVLLGLGVMLPAALALILIYRNALATSESSDAVTVGHLISVASDATSSLNEQDAQTDALDLVSSNVRVRLWYGQQFCVLIDQWLDEGAALSGTIFSGIISSLPTLLMSDKNALANDINFEALMIRSQRFPDIDLAPTPWMQWLYELGILGLVVGALLYAWLARMIEHRVSKTGSLYEILFWLGMFISIMPPEHTTDSLVLSARIMLVHVIVIGLSARTLTWLSTLGRRQHPA